MMTTAITAALAAVTGGLLPADPSPAYARGERRKPFSFCVCFLFYTYRFYTYRWEPTSNTPRVVMRSVGITGSAMKLRVMNGSMPSDTPSA